MRAAAVAGAAAALAVRALWLEPRRLRVVRLLVRPDGWPGELDGLRVACLSDLHTGAPHVGEERVARIAELLSAESPDLIVLLGDYVDPKALLASDVPPEALRAPLSRLRAPLGVFAVLGNHDWANDGRRVAAALAGAGITVLENEPVRVSDALWLVGLADPSRRQPDIAGSLAGVPPGAACIALSHHPDLFPRLPDRVALTLAGHTHGAQVNLPGVRGAVTPSRFGARYAGGFFREGRRQMYVTRGLGTSRLAVRFRAAPEVAVLELQYPRP